MGIGNFARLAGYLEEVEFALELGDGPVLRDARERISQLALSSEERQELARIDGFVIGLVVNLDHIEPFLLDDDETAGLDRWWWHLGKVRNRTYPAHRLPARLRDVYLEGLSQAA